MEYCIIPLRNVMMMIIRSLVKIITTHIYTRKHTRMHKKNYSVKTCLLRSFATTIFRKQPQSCRETHVSSPTYTHTHTLTISNTNFTRTYTHILKKCHTNLNVNISGPYFSSFLFSNMPDDCGNKAAWNPGSQMNIHAIK